MASLDELANHCGALARCRPVSDPERNETTYVTKAGQVLYLNVPHGLIPPPMIDLHQPLVGPMTFFLADAYRLPVPKDPR